MQWNLKVVTSVQFSSVAQSCPTLCNPMNCSTPGLPIHHQLPEFTQIHVHRVGDTIQPSYPLSSPFPPAPIPPSIRVFSNDSTLRIRWPKYWSFMTTRKSGGGLVPQLCSTLLTPWTVAHQVPLSWDFSRQEYWSGVPLPSPINYSNHVFQARTPESERGQ